MRKFDRWWPVFFVALTASVRPAFAQVPPPAGLETPWDARQMLSDLDKDNEQLKPLLDEMNPQAWYDQKGASSTYIVQWHTAQTEVNDVIAVAKVLGQNPQNLSQALDLYFRLEALDVTSRSVEEGAHKYGARGPADQLSELIARNFNSREHFRNYLRELAQTKEASFKVADEEAQRCRGMISREPPPKPAKKAKSN
ncbi:MAG TPA: hypothetical protein VHZ07_02165 [Bryobacteraceae bacterium]|nr:hypothetical protein [Bryobacteraceae bacterium]